MVGGVGRGLFHPGFAQSSPSTYRTLSTLQLPGNFTCIEQKRTDFYSTAGPPMLSSPELRERPSLAHPARAPLGRGLTSGGLQGIVSLGRSFLNCQNPRGSEGAKREELICSWPWR